jgi:hypothetical protein
MRIKFAIALVLAVIGLLLVTAGVGSARQDNPNEADLDYQVYLPLVAKPPCTWVHPEAYVAVNRPIIKKGDWVTVTGVIISDCAIVGNPDGSLHTMPEGLLSPSSIISGPFGGSLNYGAYREFTFTVQAVQAGIVSIVVGSSYETQLPNWPPWQWWWGYAESSPAVIRIVP